VSERSAADDLRRGDAEARASLAFLSTGQDAPSRAVLGQDAPSGTVAGQDAPSGTVAGQQAPAARSALLRSARAAGIDCGEREGWIVALSAGDAAPARMRAVAFADVCHRHVCEMRSPAPGEHTASQPASRPADALDAVRRDGWWECPTGPDRLLMIADGAQAPPPFFQRRAAAVDLSCSLGGLLIAGPLGRELIARFCALDLRPARTAIGGWRPGSVARTPGYVLREAEERYLLLFGWAYSQYVWDVVSDAASALGGGPVGLDDLEAGGDA